ncbi:methylated-DNA--[protein]-cysteine S-methyltransferase [Arthrobacter sp. NPDC092385]|uniref:methylated-DNA--[protein]-cysteine S-methyltransferase n=1 Tax=Arthrobacter sp. NPDC092385 TaxID=3363943 RepID=UPI0038129C48
MISNRRPAPVDARWHIEVPSPIGPLRLVAGAAGVVGLYHGEHDPAPTEARLGRRVPGPGPDIGRSAEGPGAGSVEGPGPGAEPGDGPGADASVDPSAPAVTVLEQAGAELGEYFAGTRQVFEVPVDVRGTPFQLAVWAALSSIPYGERRSYRDIAEQLGNPRMGRAIGAAVRSNPVSIIVPGHRVVSSTGAVVGYAAGTGTKTWLLDLELSHRSRQ